MKRFKVLRTSFIDGKVCEADSEVELDEKNKEYVEMLLADGNITADLEASPRTEGDPRAAGQEVPAANVPLGEENSQPTPEQVAQDVADLEDGRGNSDQSVNESSNINIQ